MEAEAPIIFEVENGVATITLNRPDRLNAMTYDLMIGVQDALKVVSDSEDVRVVVLTGAGKGFCAGADIGGRSKGSGKAAGGRKYDPDDITFDNTIRALMECPVPTLACVNGAAAGGGFGLSLSCDITIAKRSAYFVATFVPELGIVPDMGSTWHLPLRVGRARALGISLLGERISATQAQEWGLIWKSVDNEHFSEEIGKTVAVLKASSPSAVRRTRDAIDAALSNSISDQLSLETANQAILIPRNMPEGIRAFRDKRKPEFGAHRD